MLPIFSGDISCISVISSCFYIAGRMKSDTCKWLKLMCRQHKLVIPICMLTFFVVLPLVLKENAYSPYNKWLGTKSNASTRLKLYKLLNDKKYFEDVVYLARMPNSTRKKLLNWDSGAKYKLLVTLITTSRRHHGSASEELYSPNYLTQTVARYAQIEEQRPSHQLTDIKLVVCNVDYSTHEEVNLLSSVVDVMQTRVHKAERIESFELEKRDYANCLKQSLQYNADYILLVEDDALPHFNLLDRLDHLFFHRVTRLNNEFGFIKLFHPTRLNGYISPEINRLVELAAMASLIEHAFTFILYILKINRSSSFSQRMIRFLYFLLVLLAIGRINIQHLRALSPYLYRLVPAPSCCTPAIVFTPSSALRMVQYLESVKCSKRFHKDSAMDAFTKVTGLQTWFFEPKLYTHIGVYTTRSDSIVDPQIVD